MGPCIHEHEHEPKYTYPNIAFTLNCFLRCRANDVQFNRHLKQKPAKNRLTDFSCLSRVAVKRFARQPKQTHEASEGNRMLGVKALKPPRLQPNAGGAFRCLLRNISEYSGTRLFTSREEQTVETLKLGRAREQQRRVSSTKPERVGDGRSYRPLLGRS